MLTYSGMAKVSFEVPASGVEFVPVGDLVLAPAPRQFLGTLTLQVIDTNYDFSEAVWESSDPLLTLEGSGVSVDVLLDATSVEDGMVEDYPIPYSVDY